MHMQRKKIWIFLGAVFLLSLYNLTIPFNFNLDISYSTRYFARDKDLKTIEISPISDKGGVLQIEIDSLGELRPEFINCLLAAEDKTLFKGFFYFKDGKPGVRKLRLGSFRGIPLVGTIRAIMFMGTKGGGSGLIQQLAKNLVLVKWEKYTGTQKHMQRKYAEIITAFALTSVYSREELLRMYLNTIPIMGNTDGRIYGFKTAAFRFFGKSDMNELSLDQFATLVASLKGGRFSKLDSTNMDTIMGYRGRIFDRMAENNMLTKAEADRFKTIPIKTSDRYKKYFCFRSAMQYIKWQAKEIAEKNNLDTNLVNYKIYTTLSRWIQTAAADAVEQTFIELNQYRNLNSDLLETGLAVVSPETGELLAMIGDADPYHFKGHLNHAFQTKRQIGSTMKPFVYATFFENGGTPQSMLLDDSIPGKFNPKNYNGTYSGQSYPASYCLSHSLNMPTANLINQRLIYASQVRGVMTRCGFQSKISLTTDMVLGTGLSSPLEMALAYCPFANGGKRVPIIAITKIEDRDGVVLWSIKNETRQKKLPSKPIIRASTAKDITICLTQALQPGGTGNKVRNYFSGIAAGKTGTTSNNRDAWFVGYTPKLTCAVWVGYNNNTALPEEINTGGKVAAPIWGRMMKNMENMRITYYSDSTKNKWPF